MDFSSYKKEWIGYASRQRYDKDCCHKGTIGKSHGLLWWWQKEEERKEEKENWWKRKKNEYENGLAMRFNIANLTLAAILHIIYTISIY